LDFSELPALAFRLLAPNDLESGEHHSQSDDQEPAHDELPAPFFYEFKNALESVNEGVFLELMPFFPFHERILSSVGTRKRSFFLPHRAAKAKPPRLTSATGTVDMDASEGRMIA
jgi:hypothetical protein